jgi:hypothetical protein
MQIKVCAFQWAFILLVGWTPVHAQKVKAKPNFRGQLTAYSHQNGANTSKGKGAPLATSLYVYEPTLVTQLDTLVNDRFAHKIASKRVATLRSDSKGFFQLRLKPGKYSLFIQFDRAYYIPYFSGSQWVALFEVSSNGVTEMDLKVYSKDSYQ